MRAFLLIDVLKDFEHEDGWRLLASFRARHGGLTRALSAARGREDLVIFANGGDAWAVTTLVRLAVDGKGGDLVRALIPRQTEPVFLKSHYSAFEGTSLAAALDGLHGSDLVLAGGRRRRCACSRPRLMRCG